MRRFAPLLPFLALTPLHAAAPAAPGQAELVVGCPHSADIDAMIDRGVAKANALTDATYVVQRTEWKNGKQHGKGKGPGVDRHGRAC